MSGRPEMSSTLQNPNVEPAGSATAVIALIGPNATHRRVMAKALSAAEGHAVREFIDYPANLADVSHLLEEHFDVVMIDVDSDQSYALQIIEAIAKRNSSVVMAYSMRNDPDLIRECMRVGARDFLPLPEDADAQAEPEPEPPPAPPIVAESMTAPAPTPTPAPEPELTVNPADFLRSEPVALEPPVAEEPPLDPKDFLLATPREVPEAKAAEPLSQPQEYSVPSRPQFIDPRKSTPPLAPQPAAPSAYQAAFQPLPKPVAKPAQQPIPLPPPTMGDVRRNEPPSIQPEELRKPNAAAKPARQEPPKPTPKDEIDAWDSLWIKPALAGATKTAEPAAAPTPDEPARKKPAAAIPSGPQLVQRAAAKAEVPQPSAPPAPAAPMFRAVDSESSEPGKKSWVRWAVLGGAALVIVGLVLMVFMPSHRASAPAPAPVQPDATTTQPAAAQAPTPTPAAEQPIAKPSAAIPLKADQPQPAPVSSAMMDAQLNAPTRIAGSLRKSSQQADEAPPSGFTPGAIDSGNALPGQVFNQQRGVKIVPALSAISAGVAEGMLVHRTSPVYPEIAKAAHVSGTVVLGANITKTGALTNLHVLSGPTMLREPALNAVKTWRYRPYLLDNQPVEVETTIRVVFSLQG